MMMGERRFMRAFLRDIQSGLYFSRHGNWTPNPERAMDFKAVNRAIKHAERSGLRGVELVVGSAGAIHLTALPVGLMHPAVDRWHD